MGEPSGAWTRARRRRRHRRRPSGPPRRRTRLRGHDGAAAGRARDGIQALEDPAAASPGGIDGTPAWTGSPSRGGGGGGDRRARQNHAGGGRRLVQHLGRVHIRRRQRTGTGPKPARWSEAAAAERRRRRRRRQRRLEGPALVGRVLRQVERAGRRARASEEGDARAGRDRDRIETKVPAGGPLEERSERERRRRRGSRRSLRRRRRRAARRRRPRGRAPRRRERTRPRGGHRAGLAHRRRPSRRRPVLVGSAGDGRGSRRGLGSGRRYDRYDR